MPTRDLQKNFVLYIDGRGYAGRVKNFKPPKLTLVEEDLRAGGMDAPVGIDMGMEKLTCSFNLFGYDRDVLALFGFVPGGEIRAQVRVALQSPNSQVKAAVHSMRGKIVDLEAAEITPGEAADLSVMMSLHYYRLDHGGLPTHEIDVRNMIRMVNGVDQLLLQRKAMGIL